MAAPIDEAVAVVEASVADDFHACVTSELRKSAASNNDKLLDCTKKLTAWLKKADNRRARFALTDKQEPYIREMLSTYVINDLGELLNKMTKELPPVRTSPEDCLPAAPGKEVDLATEGLLCLRNACAACVKNQATVSRCPVLFDTTKSLLIWGLQRLVAMDTMQDAMETCDQDDQHMTTTSVTGLLRSGAQFLGNAVVGQEVNSRLVWEKFSDIFSDLLHCPDNPFCDYVAMVIYNILMVEKGHVHWLASHPRGQAIGVAVFDLLSRHNSDWCLCIIQTLLTQPQFVQTLFPLLQPKQRQLMLEVTLHMLELSTKEEQPTRPLDGTISDTAVAAENIAYVCAEFKTNAYRILGLHQQADSIDEENVALLTVTYLDILCSATANHHGYQSLRSDVDLLKCSINLLHCMRLLGEEGENIFSNVCKLADSHAVHTHEAGHPVLGLKKNLIRLVGNMSYSNREIQDEVRRLGGIPLIMHHMNIDARNNFITQWAVVAIRNLCEDNADNQAVIADTKLQDVADNPQLLQQFGVDAEIRDGKIVIKKTDTNNLPPTSET